MPVDASTTRLLSKTLRRCLTPAAEIVSIRPSSMPHKGFSAAQMLRYNVQYAVGQGRLESVSLLVKHASLVERRTMQYLFHQGHPCIPFCCTEDLQNPLSAPLCMQFIPGEPGVLTPLELEQVASRLAAIHARSLQDRSLLEWLPPSDAAFIESGYVLGTFRASWDAVMRDAEFRAEYGQYTTALESAGQRFAQVVDDLYQAGDTSTLIHADLHDANVLAAQGQAYIIDWEQARFGSFYLDLPNLFSAGDVHSYYLALQDHGISIAERQFFQHYREMGRYIGFKYLGFVLSHWSQRSEPGSWVHDSLNNLVGLALNGARIPG